MGSLQVDVLGTSFTLRASEDDAYLKKLLGYYTKLTEQIQKSGILQNSLQISILAGIMLCDELYKEKSESQQNLKNHDYSSVIVDKDESDEAEKIAVNLIEKIEKALS